MMWRHASYSPLLWSAPAPVTKALRFSGKIRSYGRPQACRVIEICENDMTVEFDQPQFAPCPGQKLVLYNSDDNIVAGGTISA